MKPIHKFNNSRAATLCHKCSVIISIGMTKDLYCERCKPKEETVEEYYLPLIKNMLEYTNDALAIRFMEKYYHAKKEQDEKHTRNINGQTK